MPEAPTPEAPMVTARRYLADDTASALADIDDAGRRIPYAGLDDAARLALGVALGEAWQALTTAQQIVKESAHA
jgi:hypothetical protein